MNTRSPGTRCKSARSKARSCNACGLGNPESLTVAPANIDGGVAAAIFVGFVFGRPVGVLLFSALAVTLRLAKRPIELSWGMLAAGALLTGIGFTMALFIAQLASGPGLLNSAKFGILGASLVSATCGLLALVWLTSSSRR